MSKGYRILTAAALLVSLPACGDWLTTEPQTVLTDEIVWGDPAVVLSVLADYYDRIPQWEGLENNQFSRWASLDEAIPIGSNPSGGTFPYTMWGDYSWTLMRDIHIAMAGISAANTAPINLVKPQLIAELRFLRAWNYFELAKRYGGVPLITSHELYDFSGDASPLHAPRAREDAVYDFIASEMDAIMGELGNAGNPRRANRAAALALKSRAMLYAASLARHNSEMPAPITLPGGEVGIPASKAAEYYTKSLEASRALIGAGSHTLNQGADPSDAFHAIFVNKRNPEVILAKDYLAGQGKNHWFTMRTMPVSMRVDMWLQWSGPEISATANVLETFDYLDGSPGQLRGVGNGTPGSQSNWIFYDRIDQIFDGRDGRMHGTLLVPGQEFAGKPVRSLAGVYQWNAAQSRYDRLVGSRGTFHTDGGILTDVDGPAVGQAFVNVSGLYMKKYLDPNPGAGRHSPGADTWWVFFRLGEIYMNAAEAAFELGLHGEALGYVNTLRQRAGFPANSLTQLTRDRIRSERWSELAYEDHRLWDLKRWRIAHLVWDGDPTNQSTREWVLYPYRVVHPGHPNHGKYVYDRFVTSGNTQAYHFRMGNYYAEIPASAINANPLLVRNPFH
jgi:starch-binding outer membrane protein, SusD/RagB family